MNRLDPFLSLSARVENPGSTELPLEGGQLIWTWIAWGFVVYWILFVAGVFLDQRALNSVGGLVILAILAWSSLQRLWVRVDALFVVSVLAALLPLGNLLASPTADAIEAYVKYCSLCIVLALAGMLRLPPVSDAKRRSLLAAGVLAILFISTTIYRGNAWDGGTRHAGLFPNPNNLALIPFLLLLMVERTKDRLAVRIGAHVIAISILAFTGTSGAISAYAIGLGIHLTSALSRSWRSFIYGSAVITLGGVGALIATDGAKFLPATRFTNQITVVQSQFHNVLEGDAIAYYEQERVLGSGTGSAVWRLAHWRHTLQIYGEGTAVQKLFGFGPGSTVAIMGILPHNEYIRLLFETGLIGFCLFLYAWFRTIRNAGHEVRYIGIIVAIYSFSENNFDNFPFMSLLILGLSAKAAMHRPEPPKVPRWMTSLEGSDLDIANSHGPVVYTSNSKESSF